MLEEEGEKKGEIYKPDSIEINESLATNSVEARCLPQSSDLH